MKVSCELLHTTQKSEILLAFLGSQKQANCSINENSSHWTSVHIS